MHFQVFNFDLHGASQQRFAITGGGRLVLGQELDTLDGGFNVYQSFTGEMADWVLLNESLSTEEMKDYVACRGLPSRVRPLLHFDSSLSGWELKGSSLSYNLTTEEVCGHRFVDSLVMFPIPMTREEAAEWCHKVGGHLPVPQNRDDNEELVHLGTRYTGECLNSWSTVAWLGITGNLSTGVWNPTPLKWNNFRVGSLSPDVNCDCISVQAYSGIWTCVPCEKKTCTVCRFTNTSILTLRGDCEDTGFDRYFFIKGIPGRTPVYVGYFQSRILLSKKTWRLESTIEGIKSYAEMIDDAATSPLGRHLWKINSDECGKYEVRKLCCE